MFLSEYHKSPDEVDNMSINDVYMILYSRAVKRINQRFAENIRKGASNSASYQKFASKYVSHVNKG